LWQSWPSSSPGIASQGNNNQITFFLLCLFLCECVIEYFRIQKEVLQERRTRMAGSGPANIISSFYCLKKKKKEKTTRKQQCLLCYITYRIVSISLFFQKVIFFFFFFNFKPPRILFKCDRPKPPSNLRKIKSSLQWWNEMAPLLFKVDGTGSHRKKQIIRQKRIELVIIIRLRKLFLLSSLKFDF
jgi:hypothetical protein